MMKLSNIVVATRLKEYTISQVLPAARSRVEANGRTMNIVNDESPATFEVDACVDGGDGDEMLLAKVDYQKALSSLFHGVSVAFLGLGMEGEKPGAFSSILKSILATLGGMIEEQRSMSVCLSYGMFGVSDASCIDLLSYARKEMDEVEALKEWVPLHAVHSTSEIARSIEQGYSLPCAILIRMFIRPADEALPGAMSTLLLADLGSMGGGGSSLEKSFAQLRSVIMNYDQFEHAATEPISLSSPVSAHSYLTCLLEDCFGGNTLTVMMADVPKTCVTRSLLNHFAFLTAIRRIKNRPVPNLETPEMIELSALVETHSRLEVEHRSVRRELKHLQKALKIAEAEHDELVTEKATLHAGNETKRWEYEYELARLAMEKVAVHEKIRQCEIDLVCMEHERLVLLAEMEVKKMNLSELEGRLKASLNEKELIEKEFSQEIDGLSQQLGQAQKKLLSTEQEKAFLEGNLKSAAGKISDLESKIVEIQGKLDIRNAEGIKEHTTELKKLRAELSSTRDSELSFQKKLLEVEKSATSYQSSVQALESKLSEMKLENATLIAKIEVLSRKPQSPEISRTLQAMEDKWRVEREAMRNVMDDLRKMISEKEVVNRFAGRVTENATDETNKPARVAAKQSAPPPSSPPAAQAPSAAKRVAKTRQPAERQPVGDVAQRSRRNKSIARSSGISMEAAVVADSAASLNKKSSSAPSPIPDPNPPVTKAARGKAAELEKPKSVTAVAERGGKVGAAVRLGAKRKNKPIDNNDVSAPAEPIGKLLRAEQNDEVEIPGTPQKPTAAPASPAKVWKPSAFIPGVARKPLPSTSNENTLTTGLFANFNFADRQDEGLGKRIKLPDRAAKSTEAAKAGAVVERKHVDPTVFSTIMGSFDIPGNLKK